MHQKKPFFIFVTSYSQQKLDAYLMELIRADINPYGLASFLYVGVTRRKCQIFSDLLIRQKPCWKPEAMTLPGLTDRLFQLLRRHMEDPYSSGKEILAQSKEYFILQALNRLKQDGMLNYFDLLFNEKSQLDLEMFPGMIARIAEFFSLLKQNDIEESLIEKSIDEFGMEIPGKNEDLVRLYHGYQNLLDENNLFDRDDKAVQVREVLLKQAKEPALTQYRTLILDGIIHLTKIQEDILLLFLPGFERIIFTGPPLPFEKFSEKNSCAAYGDNQRIYQSMQPFFQRVKAQTEIRVIKLSAEPVIALARYLYQDKGPAGMSEAEKERLQDDTRLHVMGFHNRVSEVQAIARLIKSELQSNGSDFNRFNIIFPHLHNYLSIIYEIFPQYGIPFGITMGMPLASIPVAILIKKMLDIAAEFRRDDIFTFFSSRLVQISAPTRLASLQKFLFETLRLKEHSPPVAPEDILTTFTEKKHLSMLYAFSNSEQEAVSNENSKTEDLPESRGLWCGLGELDRVARAAGIVGGSDILNDWYLPMEQYFHMTISSAQMQEKQAESHRIDAIKQTVSAAILNLWILDAELDFFRFLNVADPGDTLQAVEKKILAIRDKIVYYHIPVQLVTNLQHANNLTARDKRIITQRDIQALTLLDDILQEMLAIAKEILSVKDWRGMPLQAGCDLAQIRQLRTFFLKLLQEKKVYQAQETGGIQITEALEMRGLYYRKVIIGGMTSDEFPGIPAADFIIPDRIAIRALREINPIDESKYLMTHLLANSEEVFFTFPRSHGNSELYPSAVIEDILSYFSIHDESRPLSLNLETPSSNEIFAVQELFSRIGSSFTLSSPAEANSYLALLDNKDVRARVRQILRTDLARDRQAPFGVFDGLLSSADDLGTIIPEIDEHFWKEDSCYSVSSLEQYAACPQRFFYENLLGLSPLEEISDEMQANVIGILVHEILAKFFRQWVSGHHGKIMAKDRIAAIAAMEKIARQVIEEKKWDPSKNLLLQHQAELILEGLYSKEALQCRDLCHQVGLDRDLPAGKKGILRGIIDFEASSTLPLIPKEFEYSFGFDEDRLVFTCSGYPDIKIRGKIDRIDFFDPSDSKVRDLRINGSVVMDYKTGSIPTTGELEKGLTFQLPLYIMALAGDIPESAKEFAGLFYAIGNGNNIKHASLFASEGIKRARLLLDDGDRRQVYTLQRSAFQAVKEFIRNIHKNILCGVFHYSFDEAACRTCACYRICRRDEARITCLKNVVDLKGNTFSYYLPYKNREFFKQ